MKLSKGIAIAIGFIVVVGSITWYLRNTLIQRISNPLLQDFGIVVTDVSLDALATRDATISYLELVHDKGTTIAIENLTLPIRTSSNGLKTYRAERVSVITSTRDDAELFDLAQLIGQVVSLPGSLGPGELIVSEFELPPYPPIHDLHWTLTEGEQIIAAKVESITFLATISRTNATTHTIDFSLSNDSATASDHSITAILRQTDQAVVLDGSSSMDLPAWEPLARLTGIVPHGISILSGVASLDFAVEIPNDATQPTSVTAELKPSSSLQFVYSEMPAEITTVSMESGSAVTLVATLPDVTWSLQQANASLLVFRDEWGSIPLAVSELSCEPGPVCLMNTVVEMTNAALPFGTAEQVHFSSAEKLVFRDEGLRIEVQPDAALEIGGLSMSDTGVKKLAAQLASNASIELTDTGWQLVADSLDASIDSMSLSEDVSVTASLFFENLVVSEMDEVLFAKAGLYIPPSQATFDTQMVDLPGVKGELLHQAASIAVDLQTIGLHKDGGIKALLNLDTGAGELFISDTAMSFGARDLSSRVKPWDNNWDIADGIIFVDLEARWDQSDTGLNVSGKTSTRIDNLSGHYGDTAFVGLSTTLEATYESAAGSAVKPSSFTLALIDMGLPLENISANYTLYPELIAFDMDSLEMAAFGGSIRADPFSFRTDRSRNTVILRGKSIELSALLTLKEFEAIEVSGSIGALLPVTIEGDTITIVNGTLTGEAPGGVIRYLPGRDPDVVDTSSIGMVTRALSNLEYETLTSEVEYNSDGDLNLQLHLTGRNPDLDENRPVVLNLGVENNVPQMLKSLQAARAVEEILEKRLNK